MGLNDFDREMVGDADFRKPRTSNNSDEEMQFDDLSDAVKDRGHRCSNCGSGKSFWLRQALRGHMRRHYVPD
uniref:C2H2-type domain-containing protein n=1 Tax=Leersia perrieri TaxID=77586 RepID=A0A0D9XTK5_9ORYZ